MKTINEIKLRAVIRKWIILFIVFLILSGVTAFPVEAELSFLMNHSFYLPELMKNWLTEIYNAVKETNFNHPYLSYGTDWLAYAHIVIATAFIGPLRDPVKNIWVIQFGMIACVMVFPLALIGGPIGHIPFFWQMIDCSFGIVGIIPLYICHKKIKILEVSNK